VVHRNVYDGISHLKTDCNRIRIKILIKTQFTINIYNKREIMVTQSVSCNGIKRQKIYVNICDSVIGIERVYDFKDF
jgi:hypothetical protein